MIRRENPVKRFKLNFIKADYGVKPGQSPFCAVKWLTNLSQYGKKWVAVFGQKELKKLGQKWLPKIG